MMNSSDAGAKVVALPGAKLDDGSIPANVVALLEEVLAEARAGRVAAVAIAYVSPPGRTAAFRPRTTWSRPAAISSTT